MTSAEEDIIKDENSVNITVKNITIFNNLKFLFIPFF